ncbi:MAG: hypothetical protein JSS81_24845 [Acidobacteria bacterium]|nr:hypothetical protein [Acidobacteriota bacterium]
MKKIMTLSLVLASTLFTAGAASAQTNYPYQTRDDRRDERRDDRRDDRRDERRDERRNDRDDWRRERVETRTRIVREGRKVFRETIRIKYKRNGRIETKVISRVRIR